MANEKNLLPLSKRTKKDRKEIASKGGKARVEQKKKIKTMAECFKILLSLPPSNRKDIEMLEEKGLNPEDVNEQMLLVMSMCDLVKSKSALSVQAFNAIVSILGEKTEKIEISSVDKTVKEIEEYINNKYE